MNLDLVWDAKNFRADWRVTGGRLSTGNLLVSAVLISIFTDRVAQPDYQAQDGNRRGWWHDTLAGRPIGSRLWQLRRRTIASRQDLINEATDMLNEALAWLVDDGIVAGCDITVTSPPARPGSSGNLLAFVVQLRQPGVTVPAIRALWSAV